MRKLIFTKGTLPALDYFTEQFCAACEQNGWEYTVAEMGKPLTEQVFASWVTSGEPCLAVIFNNVGLWLKMGDRNFWEQHHVPVVNILVDHPRAFYRYLEEPLQDLTFCCIDRNHVEFVRKFYPAADVVFLPHGGNREGELIPWAERPIDILLLSSCQAKPELYLIDRLPDQGASFYQMVIPALREQDSVTSEAAVQAYLAQTGQEDFPLEKYLNESYAFTCENHARRFYKKNLLRAFSEAGLSVEVYGEHWDDENETYGPGIRLHGRIPARDCNALMPQAKFALNAMPWFRDGSHERVFNAMCNGAIPVTDESLYFREILTEGENALFYDRKHPEAVTARIKALLARPDDGARMAENGRVFAEENATWEVRLKEILELAERERTF
ncbi:MAG: glycosyltransferase [Lachnospiraceae bacterium]|nr:glycosyltransferase [Lachnospiraceae bacterium]